MIYIKKELPVLFASKRLTCLLIFTIYCHLGIAQTKYFILDTNNTDNLTIKHYTLSTLDLYKVDEKIELFNVIFNTHPDNKRKMEGKKDENLALFSVLPDIIGKQTWQEISLDSIQSSILPLGKIRKIFELNTMSLFFEKYGDTTKYLNNYKIIIKKGDKFLTPKFCLLQFYAVRNRPGIFANPFGTINIELNPISIIEFEKIFKKRYEKILFPLYEIGKTPYDRTLFDRLRDRREYHSKIFPLKDGSLAYQFWTYTDWHLHAHSYEIDRGIDRFIYHPTKGIIGGSFDFYFYFHRKKLPIEYIDFIKNINEEKVILADEVMSK